MGFIYKIEVEGELYIGSTKQKLCKRQSKHNQGLNNPNFKDYNRPLYRFCRTHNVSKIICELIETVDNENIRIKEQEYIKMLEPSLNTYKAYQTIEDRLEQNNKKSNCPICGNEMLKRNIKRHINITH